MIILIHFSKDVFDCLNIIIFYSLVYSFVFDCLNIIIFYSLVYSFVFDCLNIIIFYSLVYSFVFDCLNIIIFYSLVAGDKTIFALAITGKNCEVSLKQLHLL